jgi:hypothetical protein
MGYVPTNPPVVRKVPASSVAFGEDICIRGHSVWIATDPDEPDRIVCVAPTAKAARERYKHIKNTSYGKAPERFPSSIGK